MDFALVAAVKQGKNEGENILQTRTKRNVRDRDGENDVHPSCESERSCKRFGDYNITD